MKKKLTIGIPRAGFYYRYFPFWKKFFESLGWRVHVTQKTDRRILERGLKLADTEACLPIKIFYGHVADLVGQVDFVFVESLTEFYSKEHRLGHSEYTCPYFVALIDTLRATFPDQEFLGIDVEVEEGAFKFGSFEEFGEKLKIKSLSRSAKRDEKLKIAFDRASRAQSRTDSESYKLQTTNSKKIAIVGRPYVIHDSYANVGIVEKLEKMGYEIVTDMNLAPENKRAGLEMLGLPFGKQHWYLTNELLGALEVFSKDPSIAGILYLIPFSCGPDCMIDQYIGELVRSRKPFSIISIDESSGEAGVMTRLEAFIDLLKSKKE